MSTIDVRMYYPDKYVRRSEHTVLQYNCTGLTEMFVLREQIVQHPTQTLAINHKILQSTGR